MPTPIAQFDYELPPERIAQKSVEPRDHSKLMVVNRNTGEWEHKQFFDIRSELQDGDVLVMNQSKVFKARLHGAKDGAHLEVFLLRGEGDEWEALIRPGKKVVVGDQIDLHGLQAEVLKKHEDGTVRLKLNAGFEEVLRFTDEFGEVPIPPYVESSAEALENYQTVYAKHVGSVAAPTAGFHFTDELMDKLEWKGVKFVFVTLHVGLGTFRPVQANTLEEHKMHREYVEISREAAEKINRAKEEGRRVIAVGTTTVRSLEGTAQNGRIPATGFSGDVNLFITPGFTFQIIDGLITNFHLPKSTLLVLVSAFAGRERMLAAYQEAVEKDYRFFSFGDAMFIR